jgi:hypothetical protein
MYYKPNTTYRANLLFSLAGYHHQQEAIYFRSIVSSPRFRFSYSTLSL